MEENNDFAAAFAILHKAAKDKLQKFVKQCEYNLIKSVPIDKGSLLTTNVYQSVLINIDFLKTP